MTCQPCVCELPPSRKAYKVSEVINAACVVGEIQRKQLLGRRRDVEFIIPRHIAMYICRGQGLHYTRIGAYFNRDHTTVIYACQHVGDMLHTKDELYTTFLNQVKDYLCKNS